jgi:hypothetical protein
MDTRSIGFKEQVFPNPSAPACQAESSRRSARESLVLPRTGPPGIKKQEAPASNKRRRCQRCAGRPGRSRDRDGHRISPDSLRNPVETPSKPHRDSFETSGPQLPSNTLASSEQQAWRQLASILPTGRASGLGAPRAGNTTPTSRANPTAYKTITCPFRPRHACRLYSRAPGN